MKSIKKQIRFIWKGLKIFLILFLVYIFLVFCYGFVSNGYTITTIPIGEKVILENKDYREITDILSKTINKNLSKMTLFKVNEKYDEINNKIATEYALMQELFLGDKVFSSIIDIYYDNRKKEVVKVKKIFGDSVVFTPILMKIKVREDGYLCISIRI